MKSAAGIGKAAKLPGVSVKTVQRWNRDGRVIPPDGAAGNCCRSTESQLREVLGLRHAAYPSSASAPLAASAAPHKRPMCSTNTTRRKRLWWRKVRRTSNASKKRAADRRTRADGFSN
ncbi:MAG: hypothetical protein J7479_05055 [Roseiflexus sp.]|nr:hypothetical protein [Roseiflexus sp.]